MWAVPSHPEPDDDPGRQHLCAEGMETKCGHGKKYSETLSLHFRVCTLSRCGGVHLSSQHFLWEAEAGGLQVQA